MAFFFAGSIVAWITPVSASSSLPAPTEEVPYVQTPMHVVHRMLQLADVGRSDVVWDLGSGDGRIVIEAAKRGARATGFEIDPRLVAESKVRAKQARVSQRARFAERDIFSLDFTAASVVTMYLLPEYNVKLREHLLAQMKPGSRVVSHEWDMGDWLPDETLTYWAADKPHGTQKDHRVFLWIVPAIVDGHWQVSFNRSGSRGAFGLRIAQRYQRLSAESTEGDVRWIQLRGRSISFELQNNGRRMRFDGELAADGAFRGPGWRATRIPD